MVTFYAMIGNVGYERVEAKDEVEAHRKITVSLLERGAKGLLERWRNHGAVVSRFTRQTPDKEFEARV